MDSKRIQEIGRELRALYNLRTRPIGIKFLRPDEETPSNAVSPTQDLKCHMAMCQAKAAARRDGRTIVMRKEDHWCWNPLIVYGLVPYDEEYEHHEKVMTYLGLGDCENGKKMVEQGGWTFPVYFDTDGDAALKYAIRSMPTTIFVSPDGELTGRHTGVISREALEKTIKGMLAE